MAIEITCDDCGNKYRVSDDKAGSRVKCRECGSRIDVPSDDEELSDTEVASRPKSARRRKKSSSGPPTGIIIGVVAVAAVAVIGVVLFSTLGGGNGGQQVAQGNQPAPLPNSAPAAVGTPPGPANTNVTPASTLPSSPPTQPAVTLPNTGLAGNLPTSELPKSNPASTLPVNKNAPAPAGAANDNAPGQPAIGKKFGGFTGVGDAGGAAGFDAPLPGNWSVKVDPSTLDTKIDSGKPITLKFPKGATSANVVYPNTPSVFVALGANSGFVQIREIWNLATKSKIGTLNNRDIHDWAIVALSPDGQHLAAINYGSKREVVGVWACKTGKPLGELETGAKTTNVLFASPTRLIGLCQDGSVKVWKIPSGDIEHELSVEKGNEPNAAAVSPGGKYLAAVTDKSAMKVFDLDTGELAGELTLPYANVFFAGKPDAISFSPDGVELAMVMPTGISERELLLINVADGKILTKAELNVKNLARAPERVQGNRLEWFPDRSKLLWRGHHVLDAKAGGPVWNAPEEDGSSDAPRKLLDDKRILIAAGGRDNPVLKVVPVPTSEISAAAKLVAEGGEASDAGLPPLMTADTSAYTPIATGAVGAWSMKPDPIELSGKPVKNSIPLPRDRPSLGGVYIANPSVGQALAWYTDNIGAIHNAKGMIKHQGAIPRGGKGTVDIDVIDLAAGKVQGPLSLPYQGQVMDVSPNGEAFAVKTTKPNDERIDVYTVSGAKPVAGWRPFQQKDDFFKGITLARLLDHEYCLTQNFKSTTYLWKLPECKAVWRMDEGKNFCLSPGGKYLGFQAQSRYLFMEARTGELVAELPVIMPNIHCAFHPIGTHLAMLSSDGVSRKITVIDIATGKPTADFFAPQGNDTIQWCGDLHLLLDGKWLVDLKQQKNGWTYLLQFGTQARTQPDGRHWFAVGATAFDQNLFLTGATIPEKSVQDKIDAAQLPDESLLKPGMQINLQVNLAAGSPNHPNLANEVGTNFRKGMEKNGFQVAAGSPFTFVITTSQSSDGEPMRFRSIGRLGGETSVPRIKVDCEVALLSNGQAIWKNVATMSNGTFGIVHLREGEDIGTHLSKQLWDGVANHLKNFPVPAQVFGQTAGTGLGQSALVPGGTQPANR